MVAKREQIVLDIDDDEPSEEAEVERFLPPDEQIACDEL